MMTKYAHTSKKTKHAVMGSLNPRNPSLAAPLLTSMVLRWCGRMCRCRLWPYTGESVTMDLALYTVDMRCARDYVRRINRDVSDII